MRVKRTVFNGLVPVCFYYASLRSGSTARVFSELHASFVACTIQAYKDIFRYIRSVKDNGQKWLKW